MPLPTSIDDALNMARAALRFDTYRLGQDPQQRLETLLLAQTLLLDAIRSSMQFGNNYIRVRPITLSANQSTRVLEKETNGLVRKVTIAIDGAIEGNPSSTIRVSTGSGVSVSQGGPQILPGVPFDFQEVGPRDEIWMIASGPATGYLIERA